MNNSELTDTTRDHYAKFLNEMHAVLGVRVQDKPTEGTTICVMQTVLEDLIVLAQAIYSAPVKGEKIIPRYQVRYGVARIRETNGRYDILVWRESQESKIPMVGWFVDVVNLNSITAAEHHAREQKWMVIATEINRG